MTPDTLMPIASITKQFTVGSLGTLARQGKLDWDKPVRDYLPDFRVNDDVATLRATPRDLVTHRIGLPRHDGPTPDVLRRKPSDPERAVPCGPDLAPTNG